MTTAAVSNWTLSSSQEEDELKSRLKMTEVEVKITTTTSNSNSNNSGKKSSRKSKTPVYKRRVSNDNNKEVCNKSSSGPSSPTRASSSPDSPPETKSSEMPLPAPPGGIKSYSDFMRSLAAKYNNNDYYTSTRNGLSNALDSPFQPFKTGSSLAPSTPGGGPVPQLLGFPSPFPFPLGAHGLPVLQGLPQKEEKITKGGHNRPNPLPPGFPSMMDLQSTQALLHLARSTNLLPPPPPTSQPPPSRPPAAAKRSSDQPQGPLDLSGSSTSPGPAVKRARDSLSPRQTTSSPGSQVDPSILQWSVAEVANFVGSIDICKEYAEVFKEHNIDGSSLPLLTEDHLTVRLGLKLGPALKLKSLVARKLGPAHSEICVHCAHCTSEEKKSTVLETSTEEPSAAASSNVRPASRNSSLGDRSM